MTDLTRHLSSRLHRLSRRVEFERSRDSMGQFADTSATTPETMREAYIKPLRDRLKFLRKR